MKNLCLISSFLIICSILSCNEDEPVEDSSEGLVTASITVYDANSWTSSSLPLETVEGAVINLFHDENSLNSGIPDYTVTTGVNGTGTVMIPEPQDLDGDGFYDENEPYFLIMVEANGKTNFTDGYGIAGVFFCSIDLDTYNQSGAALGDIRYIDLNGDGTINAEDLTSTEFIELQIDSDSGGPTPIDPGSEGCTNKPEESNVVYIGQ